MPRLAALAICIGLVAAACGEDSVGGDGTTAPQSTAGGTSQTTRATTVASTAPPRVATTSTEPPPPLEVVGLVPLGGAQFDFTGRAVLEQSLVWSVFSGSGGVIVENVGGPLPPGCHSAGFFDPETFEILLIGGTEADAYASVGEGGCDNVGDFAEQDMIDGDVVAINDDDLILFDFGALPAPPFDVSTQVLNPDGDNGIFRTSDPDEPFFVNDLSGATHAIGVSGLFGIDPDTGLLRRMVQPETTAGTGCEEFSMCLKNGRFQVDIINAEGSPGTVISSSNDGGLFFFADPANLDALVSIVNGCGFNDSFWIFAAATTSVEFDLTVTDTVSGESRSYFNPPGELPEPILDTSAFATLPWEIATRLVTGSRPGSHRRPSRGATVRLPS